MFKIGYKTYFGYKVLTEKELTVLLLRERGQKQVEIARELGISQAAVSRFENNARAKINQARNDMALLEELGVKVHDNIVGVAERAKQLEEGLERWKR